jgi:peptide/nickel transport system ATP-binding protein
VTAQQGAIGPSAASADAAAPLLRVRDLSVEYRLDGGPVRVVDGVSFDIRRGERFGLVGESGSGKSSLAQALPRLLLPPALITGGHVRFDGQDLLALDEHRLRAVRGRGLALVPQSGMNALNPLLAVGAQIADAIRAHQAIAGSEVRARVEQALTRVGLDPAHARSFPHQLSGGMRQRAVIAIALALRPALLILDESTAALDMLVQQQLLDQLSALQTQLGFAVLFISHDLPLTLSWCQRVGVLYAGRLVETATAAQLAVTPQHPYTQGLMRCFIDPRAPRPAELHGIPGLPPDPRQLPPGCPFHPRCPAAFDRCPRERPPLIPLARPPASPLAGEDPGANVERQAACHLVS